MPISYPRPGPFGVDCPELRKRDVIYRGIPLWEFYFPADQLADFLKGLASQAGIGQFNADKIRPNGQANVEAAALPVSVAMALSSDCDAVKNQKQVQGLQRLVHVVACMHVQLCLQAHASVIVWPDSSTPIAVAK